MIALIIISIVLTLVGFILVMIGNIKGKDWLIPIGAGVLVISVFVMGVSAGQAGEEHAYKESLNGNNPYKKEYIYKQVDSSYVIMDSVYVKKEE